MKHIYSLTIILFIAVFVSACSAAPAVPTISAVEVQNTAVSAALTIIAQTQAAIPTATPLPPTETSTAAPASTNTPALTDTPLSFPTTEATSTTAPQTNVDPCANRVLAASPKGKETIINIINTVKTQ